MFPLFSNKETEAAEIKFRGKECMNLQRDKKIKRAWNITYDENYKLNY